MKPFTIKEMVLKIESITLTPAFDWPFRSWKIQLTKWFNDWTKAIRDEAFDAAIEAIEKRGGNWTYEVGIEIAIEAIEGLKEKG